jgi:3'-5' exoribonuclease
MAGSFLSVRLADRSGEVDAKAWNDPEAVAQLFDSNDVVKVRGAIEHYNDKPQLIVSRIRRCEVNEYNAVDFYPASNNDPEKMFGELETFVAMLRNEPLRQLLESIVSDASISQRLKTAPAAMKVHHAFRGGLLEHIVSLCNLAATLTAHYPRLNLDWLIAGAILHDLGKIETLELTGVRFAYTTRGS